MEAKLVLLSKDNSHYPPIEWTRPISILPAIAKIFELSIMNNLIKAIDLKLFNRHQRGFVKGEKNWKHNWFTQIWSKLSERLKIQSSNSLLLY